MRIDRVLRQLSFREPGQKDLIESFRARGRTSSGSADDKTAVRSLGHVRPALSPQPSQSDREIGVIKLARGLEPVHLDPAARLDRGVERLQSGPLAPRALGARDPERVPHPYF